MYVFSDIDSYLKDSAYTRREFQYTRLLKLQYQKFVRA